MLELLTAYSFKEIVVFVILLALGVKGGCDFFEWIRDKYREKFDKDYKKIDREKMLEAHYLTCERQHSESMALYNKLENKIDGIISSFKTIEEKIDILTRSDLDDIKSWLVEKYNYYKENPSRPISHHTMDTIEKRYSHYKEEGGNSYIDEIIIPGLRAMAKEESRVSVK